MKDILLKWNNLALNRWSTLVRNCQFPNESFLLLTASWAHTPK